jgi:hypothetical protein
MDRYFLAIELLRPLSVSGVIPRNDAIVFDDSRFNKLE